MYITPSTSRISIVPSPSIAFGHRHRHLGRGRRRSRRRPPSSSPPGRRFMLIVRWAVLASTRPPRTSSTNVAGSIDSPGRRRRSDGEADSLVVTGCAGGLVVAAGGEADGSRRGRQRGGGETRRRVRRRVASHAPEHLPRDQARRTPVPGYALLAAWRSAAVTVAVPAATSCSPRPSGRKTSGGITSAISTCAQPASAAGRAGRRSSTRTTRSRVAIWPNEPPAVQVNSADSRTKTTEHVDPAGCPVARSRSSPRRRSRRASRRTSRRAAPAIRRPQDAVSYGRLAASGTRTA